MVLDRVAKVSYARLVCVSGRHSQETRGESMVRERSRRVGRGSKLAVAAATVCSCLIVLGAPAASADPLPEGRAYELVTPSNTGSVTPGGTAFGAANGMDCFPMPLSTASGNSVAFTGQGGTLPGYASNGALTLYEAERS